MKKNENIVNFRPSEPIARKLELAMKAMGASNRSAVLEKALELGLDLLEVSDYEPNKFLLRMRLGEPSHLKTVPSQPAQKVASGK